MKLSYSGPRIPMGYVELGGLPPSSSVDPCMYAA
jgi:hypothetical protein